MAAYRPTINTYKESIRSKIFYLKKKLNDYKEISTIISNELHVPQNTEIETITDIINTSEELLKSDAEIIDLHKKDQKLVDTDAQLSTILVTIIPQFKKIVRAYIDKLALDIPPIFTSIFTNESISKKFMDDPANLQRFQKKQVDKLNVLIVYLNNLNTRDYRKILEIYDMYNSIKTRINKLQQNIENSKQGGKYRHIKRTRRTHKRRTHKRHTRRK